MGRETVVGPKSACHERNKLPKCPCQCFPFFEAMMMHTSHSQSKQHSQPTICQSGKEENIIWPTPCYFQIIFTWRHGAFNKKGFRTVIHWLQKSMALISKNRLSKQLCCPSGHLAETMGTLPGGPRRNESQCMSVTSPQMTLAWWKRAQQTVNSGQ